MKTHVSLLLGIFILGFTITTSTSFAAAVDFDGLIAGVKPTNSWSEASVISDDEEKELFKKQEATKDQIQKDAKEKEALTKNLNYLLIQAYKGKIDKIFGNLQDNIDKYPAEVQVRIFKQVSESVTSKMDTIQEKGATLGVNRKEVLSSILEYIQSLVNANIARVEKEK